MNITIRIAQNIKETRKARGMSQAILAGLSGISPNYLSLVETCQRQITVVTLEKIAQALDISLFDLLK